MTILTDIRSLDMGRRLARRCRAIVTADAITGNATVIKDGCVPSVCSMAVVTLVATGDMVWALAGRNGAIVAGEARA